MDPALSTTAAAATIVTQAKVDQAIDTTLARSNLSCVSELSDTCGLSLRRAGDDTSWKRILLKSQSATSNFDDQGAEEEDVSKNVRLQQLQADQTPWFRGLEILDKNGETRGYVTFYIAYSSWNGKILHLDCIQCNHENKLSADQIEEIILQILANMAVEMGCARLTWTHIETPEWQQHGRIRPEMHGEVLTLCMNRQSMAEYARNTFREDMTVATKAGRPFTTDFVDNSIQSVLQQINKDRSKFQLRLASQSDSAVMSKLVHGLAIYVKEADAVMMGAADYERDGFQLDNPLFYCLIVDRLNDKSDFVPCGFAFFFFGYQLEKGRFVHLEDLFIEEEHRQGGGGSLAMATLAQIGQSLDLANFYWQALDWNTGALSFYQKIGAQIVDGLKTSRYGAHPCGALQQFAARGTY